MRTVLPVLTAFVVAFSAPTTALALLLDDTEQLQGKTVVYAGEFEEVSCPIGGKYNCLTWPDTLLKTQRGREICLAPATYVRCSYNCRGLIALDDSKGRYLFIIDSMGGVKRTSFQSFQCPAMY